VKRLEVAYESNSLALSPEISQLCSEKTAAGNPRHRDESSLMHFAGALLFRQTFIAANPNHCWRLSYPSIPRRYTAFDLDIRHIGAIFDLLLPDM
jgi:hypothetical protein